MIKNKSGKIKKIILVSSLLFLIGIILILSFDSSSVTIIPNNNATTLDTLVCTWTSEGSQVNVTWYNGTNKYYENNTNASNINLLPGIAKIGQTWNCTVYLWDDISNIGSNSILIKNANPYPPDVHNETITEDFPWVSDISAGDPDGDTVTYFCMPFGILDTYIGDTISWIPLYEDVEPASSKLYNFTCFATDNNDPQGASSIKFSLNVIARNDPPSFSFPNPKNASVNETQKLQYLITLNDEETPLSQFNLSFNSSASSPCREGGGGEKLELNRTSNSTFILQVKNNVTLSYNEIGNCTIYVRGFDPINASVFTDDYFNIEIVSVNHYPNITYVESKGINYSQNENFVLDIYATDLDSSDILNFLVSTPGCSPNNWNITTLISSAENAYAVLNASPLNESHIKCKTVIITAMDNRNGQNSITLLLNISNVNDAPVIREMSYYGGNTHNNRNITNLTAYSNVAFVYKINATDNDILFGTDTTDFLTYRDNSSGCNGNCPSLTIAPLTGIITFMPNDTFSGRNFTYKINVTDKYGTNDTKNITIYIIANTIPYFNQTPPNITSYEDIPYNITINATDYEDHNVSFRTNSTFFNISSSGLINFTPACSLIGNYSIRITINDSQGAENYSIFNLEVRMSPDAPVLPIITNRTILEEMPFYMLINANDDDLNCGETQTDNLTYSYEFLSGPALSNFAINTMNNTGIISFVPELYSQGNYLIKIMVNDTYNNMAYANWNLTIINKSNAPVINTISPYGYPFYSGFIELTTLGSNMTTINVSEDSTIYYDHNSTDADNDNLVFNWTVDNVENGSSKNMSKYWDYSSAGIHNVTLTVSDVVNGTMAHMVRFTWNTSVINKNRPPRLNNSLGNVTINDTGTRIIANYLICGNYVSGNCNETRFNDPDGETLTYNNSATSKVSISITEDTVTFTGIELGQETVVFTASDGHTTNTSNTVTIFILELPEEEGEGESSNTDSSSRSETSYVPYSVIQEVEKEKEVYFDILVPEPITVYLNNTLREVISLVNSGNVTLRGITLSAQTNSSDALINFSNNYFSELKPGETKKTDIIISGYKLLNHYEIIIWANITEPKYKDKAIVYVNAIEKSKGNQSVTAAKITFAQDLLNSNTECLELNEFIKKAQMFIEQKDYEEASRILDSVIQGCKYLVSQSKVRDERPTGIILGIDLDSSPYIKPLLIIFLLVFGGLVFITIKMKKSNENELS